VVYSIYDSTEEAVERMIEASRRMIIISGSSSQAKEGGEGGEKIQRKP